MGRRFTQGNLSDMDCITCWLASQAGDESFEKLIAQRKKQKNEELVQLAEDVKELGVSDADFRRQAAIYLLSKQTGTTMVEASEIYVKLEQERDRKPSGPYAKIAKALQVPNYATTDEKPQREKGKEEVEVLEWIPDAGTISRYNEIKRKLKEVNRHE